MRKLVLFMFMILAYINLSAQVDYVPFEQVKQIALQNAQSLWGEVYADEPIPLYNLQDELLAYTFNFSIGHPFPARESLIDQCNIPIDSNNKNDRWQIGSFGNMLVSASKNTAPIINYQQSISDEYAYGAEVKRLAAQKLNTDNPSLYRIYLMNDIAKWYCFTDNNKKVFVKVFPPVEVYLEQEFQSVVIQKYNAPRLWKLSEDIDHKWDQFLDGKTLISKANHLIPHEEYVPFYDWSYGCTPTAFAMALAYWDNGGMSFASDYGNLVKHHFQRYDHAQGETDKNVPDLQKALAIAMHTDSMTGNTSPSHWLNGFINATNARGYGFTGQNKYGTSSYYLSWTKTEIDNGRPIHWGTPGHSQTAVGYTDDNFVICHRTWYAAHSNVLYTECDLVGTIVPGGQYGAAVNIVSPFGDPRYSDVATLPNQGEDLYAGDVFEIKWDYDYHPDSYARILYSTNGGLNWTQIVENTPNDGIFDWRIPSGLAGSTLGRVKIEVRDPSKGLAAADGSYGNFDFHAGGSLPTLSEDVVVTTTTIPDYFQFTNTTNYWSVVGVRSNNSADDWDIQLHGSTSFNDIITSSSYGKPAVDFVVIDGGHTSSIARGVKVTRYSGTGNAKVEFEGGMDIVSLGSPVITSWPAGDVVEIYDVYLNPGLYGFTLDITSGSADLDFALYGSNGVAYYAPRNAYKAMSGSGGSGADEYFTYTATTADWYGLCVWANNGNSANYTLKVEKPGTWTGLLSTNWNTPGNWSGNILPTFDMDVTIPSGTPNQPYVYTANASIKSLTINSGAMLTIGGSSLIMTNDLDIWGVLNMNNASGSLAVLGNVNWHSGSSANITATSQFLVYGDWVFKSGANVNLVNGSVSFWGTTDKYITCNSSSCSFNNIEIKKTGGAGLIIPTQSTQPLTINGDIYVESGASFRVYSTIDVKVKGDIKSSGSFNGIYGRIILDGTTQSLRMNVGDYFNHLTFSQTGTVTIDNTLSSILEVDGNVLIESGILNLQDRTMRVGGSWTNNVGPAGFNKGTSRVIFDGTGYNYVTTNETFNILETNMFASAALRIDYVDVTCNQYDWTTGGIDVLAGTFTALDLYDNGIFGSFMLSLGGTINLHNSDGYVDLAGNLNIYGGNFNVYGGTYDSYWPYGGNASITMNGGVLDFKNVGISITSAYGYTLTENITGGVIRTVGTFSNQRIDFTPTGNIFEMYGTADAVLITGEGCSVDNVVINKGADDAPPTPLFDREGNPIEQTRGSTIFVSGSQLTILGDLTIDAGILNSNNKTISIGGDWHNNVGTSGFDESNGRVIFNGTGTQYCSSEDFYTLETNMSCGLLCNVSGGTSNTCQIYDWTSGGIYISSGYFSAADLVDNGLFGTFFVYNGTIDLHQDNMQSVDLNGGVIVGFAGALNVYGGNGDSYWPYGANASITMTGGVLDFKDVGIWVADHPFYTLTENITGGTIKTSGNFIVFNPAFTPAGGTVELYGGTDALIENGAGTNFHNLTVNKSGGSDESSEPLTFQDRNGETITTSRANLVGLSGDVLINGNLTVNAGKLNTSGSYALTCMGSASIENGATLEMLIPSKLKLNTSLTVKNGGTFRSVGFSYLTNWVTRAATNRYSFDVQSGGDIGVSNTIFEYMSVNGVNISSGALVDTAQAFNNCTFRLGTNLSTLLTMNSTQTLKCTGAIFPFNSGGVISNVKKSVDAGRITFYDYSGTFSGSAHESDPYNRIMWDGETQQHNVMLAAGWQGLSSYVMPTDNNIENVFAPLAPKFIIAQTMSGIYYPAGPINNIGNWLSQSAYSVKMANPASLSISGMPETDKTLPIAAGWNLIPVIANNPVNVATLSTTVSFQMVKDVAGTGVYWPAYGINTLGNLLPGKAYYVRVTSPGIVTFPANTDAGWNGKYPEMPMLETPWNQPEASPVSHLVAFAPGVTAELRVGDIVGLFTPDNICCGVAQIELPGKPLAITAFADDAQLPGISGYVSGQTMSLKIYCPATNEVGMLAVVYDPTGDGSVFADHGLSVITHIQQTATGIGTASSITVEIYPNPTDGSVTITGIGQYDLLQLFSVRGELLLQRTNDAADELSWDVSALPPGVYQLKLSANHAALVKKLIRK